MQSLTLPLVLRLPYFEVYILSSEAIYIKSFIDRDDAIGSNLNA
jgi:hypothetical protein